MYIIMLAGTCECLDGAPSQAQVQRSDMKYTWEYALLLPATPEEIQKEVDI